MFRAKITWVLKYWCFLHLLLFFFLQFYGFPKPKILKLHFPDVLWPLWYNTVIVPLGLSCSLAKARISKEEPKPESADKEVTCPGWILENQWVCYWDPCKRNVALNQRQTVVYTISVLRHGQILTHYPSQVSKRNIKNWKIPKSFTSTKVSNGSSFTKALIPPHTMGLAIHRSSCQSLNFEVCIFTVDFGPTRWARESQG